MEGRRNKENSLLVYVNRNTKKSRKKWKDSLQTFLRRMRWEKV